MWTISPDVSEDIDAEGDGGATSSGTPVDIGVLLPSHDRTPVLRRLDGGIAWLALAPWPFPGERNCLVSWSWSWSEMSSDAIDDSDDADDAILRIECILVSPDERPDGTDAG